MENDKNHCYYCKFFTRYYTKGETRFNKTDYGKCAKNDTFVNKQNICEQFKIQTRRPLKRLRLRCILSNILTDLSTLRNLVEEENKDNEENV